MNKVFIGSLPFSATEEELKDAFSKVGEVISVNIIQDRQTGRSKGFGFVEYATQEEAEAAIEMYNEKEFGGRTIFVNMARPMEKRD